MIRNQLYQVHAVQKQSQMNNILTCSNNETLEITSNDNYIVLCSDVNNIKINVKDNIEINVTNGKILDSETWKRK